MKKIILLIITIICFFNITVTTHAIIPSIITNNTNNDMTPSAIIDSEGTIYAVYASDREGNYDIFYQTSNDGGSTWSASTKITTSDADDFSPIIMQVFSGKYFIIYVSDSTGNKEVWSVTSNDGSSWSAPINITNSFENKMKPSIIQDISGKFWISWTVSVFGVGEGQVDKMQYMTSIDGATWSDISDFSINALKITNARLSEYSGTYGIVYESNGAIYYSSSSNGETWSASFLISLGTDNSEPMHIKDSTGKHHIIWTSTQNGNNDIYHSSSDTGTSWSAPSAITIHAASDASGYILQDTNDYFWFLFRSDRVTENRDIWFMKDTTIPVETEPPIDTCGDSVCSIGESCESCPSDCACTPPEPPNLCNGVVCPEKCEGTTKYKNGYCVGDGDCAYAVIVEKSEVCGYIDTSEPIPEIEENQTIDEFEDEDIGEMLDAMEDTDSKNAVSNTAVDEIKDTQTKKQEIASDAMDDTKETEEGKDNTGLIIISFVLLFFIIGIWLYTRSKNKTQELPVDEYYE
ncbi:hypothetical protein GQ473_02860 [archaeon]|nr:hypothetical protein [archaeon]